MTSNEDLRDRVNQKLADATSQILAQARAKDYEEANRLIRARGVSFGIGIVVIGTGLIGIAVLLHASYPRSTPIILPLAVALWVVGAVFIDMPNWLRARLAQRLLKRSSNR